MKKKKQELPVVLIGLVIFIVGLFIGVFASPYLLPEKVVSEEHDHTHTHDLDHMHGHDHSLIEVDPNLPIPSVDLIVTQTPSGKGYNLEIVTTDFQFDPQAVDTEYVPNRGHAHLYVDGDKITRIYDNWYFLDKLDAGEYTIKVSLNANNHSGLSINGQEIADEEVLVVE